MRRAHVPVVILLSSFNEIIDADFGVDGQAMRSGELYHAFVAPLEFGAQGVVRGSESFVFFRELLHCAVLTKSRGGSDKIIGHGE